MTGLLDFEVYNSKGQKVYQKFLDRRTLSAGRTTTAVFTWTIPANMPAGTYTVKLGVFSAGWGTLFHWNDRAATFTITSRTAAATDGLQGKPAGEVRDHLASFALPQFLANSSSAATTSWYCGEKPDSGPVAAGQGVAIPSEAVVQRIR